MGKLAVKALDTTPTTGTGAVTCDGAAPTGYLTIKEALEQQRGGDGPPWTSVSYGIDSDKDVETGNPLKWERGEATVTIVDGKAVLDRSVIKASTNGGSAVSLTGVSDVFLTPHQDDLSSGQNFTPVDPVEDYSGSPVEGVWTTITMSSADANSVAVIAMEYVNGTSQDNEMSIHIRAKGDTSTAGLHLANTHPDNITSAGVAGIGHDQIRCLKTV